LALGKKNKTGAEIPTGEQKKGLRGGKARPVPLALVGENGKTYKGQFTDEKDDGKVESGRFGNQRAGGGARKLEIKPGGEKSRYRKWKKGDTSEHKKKRAINSFQPRKRGLYRGRAAPGREHVCGRPSRETRFGGGKEGKRRGTAGHPKKGGVSPPVGWGVKEKSN